MKAEEIVDGRGGSQTFGQAIRIKRTFMVTLDDPTTPVNDIAAAPGISWLDPHPEFDAVYVTDISVSNDNDPLHYRVEFAYNLIKAEDRHKLPWERDPKFSFDGALVTGPAYLHYNDGFNSPKFLLNSANDPFPDAQRENAEWKINIAYAVETFDYGMAMAYINSVNSDSWSGAAAGTLKIQAIKGSRDVEQVEGEEVPFWNVSIDLAYRPEGWQLRIWDVGFNEIVNGKRQKILDALREPISEPAALSNGVAKAAGQPPNMLTFTLYRSAAFIGTIPELP